MAEKKFFVDINLQGNKLVNPVVGSNASMTTAGSFQYNAGRLEYYNGSTVQEVANLTDIAAITGGLILQGGYDAATNTPDILDDSSILKGFFWVVTAAGSFLGEAVQVGDSIIAKQDNPGGVIANWLILQGNVVIATDSVDGISRLATQEEANAGTEGGAVVITPATLQGKIDAQITPALNDKLSKSGDTMSGTLNMGGNNIENAVAVKTNELYSRETGVTTIDVFDNLTLQGATIKNVPTPTSGDEVANKTYVDDNTSDKLPLAGGTMSGTINMNGNAINNISDITVGVISNVGSDPIEFYNIINANNGITNLGAPTNGSDAANKTYVDDNTSNKLPLAGGTMSGTIDMGGNSIQGGNIIGTETILTERIDNANGTVIYLEKDLDALGYNTIINLPAPTNGGDAANKTYVDNAASTAESNANDYTDTAISQEVTDRNNAIKAQSFSATILSEDWLFDNTINSWYAVVTHNLGTYITVSSFYDGAPAEFTGDLSGNDYYLRSNIQPVESTIINIIKAGGNL